MDACVEKESGKWRVASDEIRKEQDGGNCSTSEGDAEEGAPMSFRGRFVPEESALSCVLQEADPSLRSG